MTDAVQVTKGTEHLALPAVVVGLAEAIPVLVVAESRAGSLAGAVSGAVLAEGALGTRHALSRHMVAGVTYGQDRV